MMLSMMSFKLFSCFLSRLLIKISSLLKRGKRERRMVSGKEGRMDGRKEGTKERRNCKVGRKERRQGHYKFYIHVYC